MKSDLKQRRNTAICKRINELLGQDEAEAETYLRDLLQPVETERVFTQISE